MGMGVKASHDREEVLELSAMARKAIGVIDRNLGYLWNPVVRTRCEQLVNYSAKQYRSAFR